MLDFVINVSDNLTIAREFSRSLKDFERSLIERVPLDYVVDRQDLSTSEIVLEEGNVVEVAEQNVENVEIDLIRFDQSLWISQKKSPMPPSTQNLQVQGMTPSVSPSSSSGYGSVNPSTSSLKSGPSQDARPVQHPIQHPIQHSTQQVTPKCKEPISLKPSKDKCKSSDRTDSILKRKKEMEANRQARIQKQISEKDAKQGQLLREQQALIQRTTEKKKILLQQKLKKVVDSRSALEREAQEKRNRESARKRELEKRKRETEQVKHLFRTNASTKLVSGNSQSNLIGQIKPQAPSGTPQTPRKASDSASNAKENLAVPTQLHKTPQKDIPVDNNTFIQGYINSIPITDVPSDEEDDDFDNSDREVCAHWARMDIFKPALDTQFKMDLKTRERAALRIFGRCAATVDLDVVFQGFSNSVNMNYQKRTSSAHWSTSLADSSATSWMDSSFHTNPLTN